MLPQPRHTQPEAKRALRGDHVLSTGREIRNPPIVKRQLAQVSRLVLKPRTDLLPDPVLEAYLTESDFGCGPAVRESTTAVPRILLMQWALNLFLIDLDRPASPSVP